MGITHDKNQQEFYLIDGSKECSLKYIIEDTRINIIRVYVHPELRNRGLAAKLTEAALTYAKENNLKIIPSCSYAHYFIARHKEYEELLA